MSADRSAVGKLFALQSWVELTSAASYLSQLIGEETSRDDILRLGLDGHLPLSVRFISGVTVKRGSTIPIDDAKREMVPDLSGDGFFVLTEGTVIPGDKVIVWEEAIDVINGVWDLPMIGAESIEVEDLYQISLFRDPPERFCLDGAFVTDGRGLYCNVMARYETPSTREEEKNKHYHPAHFYPADRLPEGSVVVVRTQAIRDLAERLAKPAAAIKPVGTRERATLLTIIAALAELARVDVKKPSSAAAAIESQTARMGARVAACTIEEHLKRVPEALEARES